MSSSCSAVAAPLKSKYKPLAERVSEATVRTEFGEFHMTVFVDREGREHLAIAKGDIRGRGVMCRVHSECMTGDVFGSLRCDCGAQLHLALKRIEAEGRGVVLYLRQEGRGIGLANKIKAYSLQDRGLDTVEANEALGFPGDLRRYDVASSMLRDLGVESVRLLSNNPEKVRGLEEAGIFVDERLAHQAGLHPENQKYMETKRLRMGHIF